MCMGYAPAATPQNPLLQHQVKSIGQDNSPTEMAARLQQDIVQAQDMIDLWMKRKIQLQNELQNLNNEMSGAIG